MLGLIGLAVIFVMVFGGYLVAGGKMGVILHSLPYEMAMIGGAAIGAFLIGNDMATVKATLRDMKKVFKGTHWKTADYRDLLCLLFELIRIARTNPVALEEHIETPATSAIFARYPRIQADHEAVDLICDTLRAGSMNYDDPHQVEEVLEKRMEANAHHALITSHALQTVADALPALGIVAAVLGVIKTMGAIDQPPEILGGMIGGALVGTFLGVFLAYGIVGPFATRLKAVADEDGQFYSLIREVQVRDQHLADQRVELPVLVRDGQFYSLIREVLVANLHAHPANICIEVGRQNTPHQFRPQFNELDQALRGLKEAA